MNDAIAESIAGALYRN